MTEEIKNLRVQIDGLEQLSPLANISTFMEYSKKYLTEARFWLGFELQRIKETN